MVKGKRKNLKKGKSEGKRRVSGEKRTTADIKDRMIGLILM